VEKYDFRFSLIEECGYRTFPPKEETALKYNEERKGSTKTHSEMPFRAFFEEN
jgi:hypothetical protein